MAEARQFDSASTLTVPWQFGGLSMLSLCSDVYLPAGSLDNLCSSKCCRHQDCEYSSILIYISSPLPAAPLWDRAIFSEWHVKM